MKLFKINYKVWSVYFPEALYRETFSIGNNEEEAIERVKKNCGADAREFKAEAINEVFGYKIMVVEN